MPLPQLLSELDGQSALAKRLLVSVAKGRVAHAVLLLGQKGTGKRTAALLYARALLCANPQNGEPCNSCPACVKASHSNHPDLHIITTPPKHAHIDVDSIRGVTQALIYQAYMGGRVVVIIDQAHTMTPQAQNALLKTLEEPPKGCTILLLCESTATLLPTVLSRCAVLKTAPLAPGRILRHLLERGVPAARAQAAAQICQGSLGRAIELCADDDYTRFSQACKNELLCLLNGDAIPQTLAALHSRRTALAQTLDVWEVMLRDALMFNCNANVLHGCDPAFKGQPKERLARMLEACLSARENLYSSAIYSLCVDALVQGIVSA